MLAVHEAVSNSVEHGYGGREPGEVDVTGVRTVDDDGERVRLLVHDDGRWRRPGDPGYRGRGITVMRGCVAQVRVHPGDDGTEVVLLSRPVPVPRARGAAPMTVAVPQVRSRVRAPGKPVADARPAGLPSRDARHLHPHRQLPPRRTSAPGCRYGVGFQESPNTFSGIPISSFAGSPTPERSCELPVGRVAMLCPGLAHGRGRVEQGLPPGVERGDDRPGPPCSGRVALRQCVYGRFPQAQACTGAPRRRRPARRSPFSLTVVATVPTPAVPSEMHPPTRHRADLDQAQPPDETADAVHIDLRSQPGVRTTS